MGLAKAIFVFDADSWLKPTAMKQGRIYFGTFLLLLCRQLQLTDKIELTTHWL